MRVAHVRAGEDVADVEVGELIDDGVVGQRGAGVVVDKEAGVHVEKAAFEVVVEALDIVAMELAAEFEGVVALDQCEIIQHLKCFAQAAARDAVGGSAEVFEIAIEIDFRKADVTGAHVEAERGGINEIGIAGRGVRGIETGAESRVAETHFVDFCGREGGEPIDRNDLHARGGNLFEVGESRTAAVAAERAKRKLLVAVAESVACAKGIVLIQAEIDLTDEVVAIIFVADGIGQGIGITGGKQIGDFDERGINGRNRGAGNGSGDGESLRGGNLRLRRNGQGEIRADALALSFISEEKEQLVFDDRAAERAAEIVVVETRLRVRRAVGLQFRIEVIAGVEGGVAIVLVERTVKLIGARARDDVDDRAAISSVLGAELRLQVELLNGVERQQCSGRAGDAHLVQRGIIEERIVVVGAVEIVVVGTIAIAADVELAKTLFRAGHARTFDGNTRREGNEFAKIAAIER